MLLMTTATTASRKRRTRKAKVSTVKKSASQINTSPAKSTVDEVSEAPKVEEKVTPTAPKVEQKVLQTLPKFTELRGLDFVILPLIYLEAFVVNILQNLDVKVPERVALK